MPDFRIHHTAISVRDLERSANFYAYFGLRPVFTWRAADGSLTLVHLRNIGGDFLELVAYANPVNAPPPSVGNDLSHVGVKHIAFRTNDVAAVYQDVMARELGEVTELQHGRTDVDLFFIRDPDGFWVEVLSDQRDLDENAPVSVTEEPRLLAGE